MNTYVLKALSNLTLKQAWNPGTVETRIEIPINNRRTDGLTDWRTGILYYFMKNIRATLHLKW